MTRRPEVLALWGRAPIPADVTSVDPERRDRLVRVIAEAMRQPVPARRGWRRGARVVAAVAAAATLMLIVAVGLAGTARRWAMAVASPVWASHADARVEAPPSIGPSAPADPVASCAPPPSNAPAAAPNAGEVARAPAQPASAPRPAPASSAATARTDLAEQNQLFAHAMNARKRGDSAEAVRAFDDFVRRYPHSPLVQDAYVERFRTLAEMGDRAGAASAARAYLMSFPHGFGRDEATGLVSDSK